MKKLLLILLCVPMMFSCGEETDNLQREITQEMISDGYTGKGTQIRGNNIYVGEWKDGKKHGQGTYTLADGSKYIGEWENGKENGQGIMVYSDSVRYEGEWNDGEWHGKGTHTYADGSKYEGEWNDGEWHGQGTYTYADGSKYEGEWNDGEWHGQGIYTFTDGRIWEGLFENGTYIPPSYCNVLINKLNRHSEDNNDELEIKVKEYAKTLDAYDAFLYYEKEEECYDDYLINYGEEIP
ncbi:hypothetical protein OAJ56_01540 [Flavobacteriales bacterium]|nr:hypothetical protein [Flavobacteriales bacterium]